MRVRRILRRTLISVGAVGLFLALWAFWLEPSSLTLAEVPIDFKWQNSGSVRVAVLADLHVGSPFNDIARLHTVVDRTNAAQPEVICILGDLVIQGVIGGRAVPPEEIATELRRLQAPLGV